MDRIFYETFLFGFIISVQLIFLVQFIAGCGKNKNKVEKNNIRAPKNKDDVAEIHDPNYQTLVVVGKSNDCFGVDKVNVPKVPGDKNAVAGTHDPNYQTLVVIGENDCFDKNKYGGPIAPPFKGGIARTHDPNYQTLAHVSGDCFGEDKAKGVFGGGASRGPKPPAQSGIARAHNPNYQTLAGMRNDCFQKLY